MYMNYNREIRKIINDKFKGYMTYGFFEENLLNDNIPEQDREKMMKIFDTTLKMTSYSDLYSKLALMQKCNTLTESDNELFEELKDISSFEELDEKFYSSKKLFSISIGEMIDFYGSSAFHKILRMKCLDEKDVANIKKINTLFDYDLESYNKDVDAKYMAKKVILNRNLEYSFSDLTLESAIFLHTLLLVDNKNAQKLLLELIKNNIMVVGYEEEINQIKQNKEIEEKIESDNYSLKYVEEYLNHNEISKLPFDLIAEMVFGNILFYQLKFDDSKLNVTKEKEKMLKYVNNYKIKDE